MRLKPIILDKILKIILKYISFFRLLKYSFNIVQNSPKCFDSVCYYHTLLSFIYI